MEEIFGKLKERAFHARGGAERIAKEVAKRTSNAITHTKLSFSINETQSKIKDIYSEIGKEIYSNHIDGADYGSDFSSAFAQLDELHNEVEALLSKLSELKESVRCDECGATNPKDAEYCSKCGRSMKSDNLEDEEPVPDDDMPDIMVADADEPIIISIPKPE